MLLSFAVAAKPEAMSFFCGSLVILVKVCLWHSDDVPPICTCPVRTSNLSVFRIESKCNHFHKMAITRSHHTIKVTTSSCHEIQLRRSQAKNISGSRNQLRSGPDLMCLKRQLNANLQHYINMTKEEASKKKTRRSCSYKQCSNINQQIRLFLFQRNAIFNRLNDQPDESFK